MSRSDIFSKIQQATSALTSNLTEATPLPDYDPAMLHATKKLEGDSLQEIFTRNFTSVSGKVMDSQETLITFLKENNQLHGYCDPALMDAIGNSLVAAGLTVETEYDRTRYDDYAFGITRATSAIAESGTLILNDEQTADRLAALSPWVHVGVLLSDEIIKTIPDAIDAFGSSTNIIWATGPSKTADVEGILIEGVHGPGEQIAFFSEKL